MYYIIVIAALSLVLALPAHADLVLPQFSTNIEIHRVFGAEHPGPYKHPASITQLANGDLYIAYYGGEFEYSTETAVYGSRKVYLRDAIGRFRSDTIQALFGGEEDPGTEVWEYPTIIAQTPFQGVGNPVVWQAPDGLVWLFYNNQYGATWSNARVKAKVSGDGAKTWSDAFMFAMEEGSMVRGQPIVLNNGDYLLPLYNETGEDRERVGDSTCSYFMRFNPETKTWTETNRIMSETGNLQAQVVQLNDNDLFCFLRRGGGYEPTEEGWMLKATSKDGGYTWSNAEPTEFPNPNSALELIKLRNGHLMLIYNDNMNARTPLAAAVSTDGGETWPYRRVIAGGDNTYAYPYAIQGQDDKIYLIYTTNRRTTIMMAVFHEDAITAYGR